MKACRSAAAADEETVDDVGRCGALPSCRSGWRSCHPPLHAYHQCCCRAYMHKAFDCPAKKPVHPQRSLGLWN
ncbi:hypothetical protein TcWFU_001761 [Taenia crassiceps]|uniref:Uncharacterized protein n=1 Tax=Taenia crassiceps TaxID=6207 RepID=A0ABR4Q1M4_9CEST